MNIKKPAEIREMEPGLLIIKERPVIEVHSGLDESD